MQLEMPILHAVGGMADLPADLVCRCNHQHEAVRLCMRNSRVPRTLDQWSDILGLKKGTLSLLLNGGTAARRRYFDPGVIEQIQLEAGNRGVSQWWHLLGQGMLYRQRHQQVLAEAL